MSVTSVLFAIVLSLGLQTQTAPPAQPPATQQPAPQPPAQPAPAPQPATPAPSQPAAPAMQTPPAPAPPAKVTDPDRDTQLMLLDRVQQLANDALKGESKSGKVMVDRAALNEIIAAASQIKTALQR